MNTTTTKPLINKVALVTGGSRSIGAAIGDRKAANAFNVTGLDLCHRADVSATASL